MDKLKRYLHTASTFALTAGILLSACASYKQNVMFKLPEGYALQQQIQRVEKNYVVQKNDQLQVDVYTNKGERIIDPDLRLAESIEAQSATTKPMVTYTVDLNGMVKLPMVGEVHAEGLTIRELEALLNKEYENYYATPYTVVKYLNKRIVILGAPGGQVIPLVNENVDLVEVLALAKGLDNTAKAQNIRVLRSGNVYVVDFSTIEGYQKGNMIMEPGDVVYVEPVRRPLSEATRDYGPLMSIVVSLATLIIVINNTK